MSSNPGVAITQFTQGQVQAGLIRFVHDGSDVAPSYQVSVSDGTLNSVPASATITFNRRPVLANNALSLNDGELVVLSASMLNATDDQTSGVALTFTASNVQHARFALISNPNVAITQFTQGQVQGGQICLIHDGSNMAPSYEMSVSDGAISTPPVSATITFNQRPVLASNAMSLNDGGTVTLNASQLNATDDRTSAVALTFNASNVQHGRFQLSDNPGVAITQFTQGQLQANLVQFVHDGSNVAPSYQMSVSDGTISTPLVAATIIFNQRPVLASNAISLDDGGTVILTPNMLNANDNGVVNSALIFSISNIQHAHFAWSSNPNVAITQFTQGEVQGGLICLVHDGSNVAPSYQVDVSDGTLTSTSQLASVTFNYRPVFVNNRATVSDGQTLTVSTSMLRATDNGAVLDALIFSVSNVVRGQFELLTSPGIAIPQFTQAQVLANQIRFVPDGSNLAPSWEVSINDGVLASIPVATPITFNRRPVWINRELRIEEGQRVVITPSLLSVNDDAMPSDIRFTVTAFNHGKFELASARGQAVTQFTAAQVEAGEVEFEHDGLEIPPEVSLTVSDGVFTEGPIALSIIYSPINDPPRLNRVMPPQVHDEGQVFSLLVPDDTIVDPEDELLSWLANTANKRGLPRGLAFDSVTRIFTGQLSQVGHWNISLQATDPEGLEAVTFFALQIVEAQRIRVSCTMPGLSNYASDDVECGTARNTLIAIPSAIGTLLFAAMGLWLKRRLVEKSWADKRYEIHNILRRELRLEIETLNQEAEYKNVIYYLIGDLLGIVRGDREGDIQYCHRIGDHVSQLSATEIEQHGFALVSAIREQIYFPSLYSDTGDKTKPMMPIYRYFYDTIPNPLSCLTTYKFHSEILLAAAAKIVATGSDLSRSPVKEDKHTKSYASSAVGFFCCRSKQNPQSKPVSGPAVPESKLEIEVSPRRQDGIELTPF